MTTIPKFRGFLYLLANLLGDYRAIKTGRLFPAAAMIALASCAPSFEGPRATIDDYFAQFLERLGGTAERYEPEILAMPVLRADLMDPPVCSDSPGERLPNTIPVARADFEDGSALLLDANTTGISGAVVVFFFAVEDDMVCLVMTALVEGET